MYGVGLLTRCVAGPEASPPFLAGAEISVMVVSVIVTNC